jgi:hypothetical protein
MATKYSLYSQQGKIFLTISQTRQRLWIVGLMEDFEVTAAGTI